MAESFWGYICVSWPLFKEPSVVNLDRFYCIYIYIYISRLRVNCAGQSEHLLTCVWYWVTVRWVFSLWECITGQCVWLHGVLFETVPTQDVTWHCVFLHSVLLDTGFLDYMLTLPTWRVTWHTVLFGSVLHSVLYGTQCVVKQCVIWHTVLLHSMLSNTVTWHSVLFGTHYYYTAHYLTYFVLTQWVDTHATWGKRLYFPSEERHGEDFFARKNLTALAGSEPGILGTRGQHANH
jgi:hypothetical protein